VCLICALYKDKLIVRFDDTNPSKARRGCGYNNTGTCDSGGAIAQPCVPRLCTAAWAAQLAVVLHSPQVQQIYWSLKLNKL